MNLGDKVRFKRELKKDRHGGNGWLEEEYETHLTGIVCGERTIGSRDYDCKMSYKKKVCLVATDLRGFHRVPEEWLERWTYES